MNLFIKQLISVIIKLVLSIALLAILTLVQGALKAASDTGSIGIFGLVIGAAFLGGLYAIWTYKPSKSDDKDIHKLDKS